MRKNILFLMVLALLMISQQLYALKVTVYGSGGVHTTISNGGSTIRICPENGDQVCDTLIIESGEKKEIISAGKEDHIAIAFQALNSLIATHDIKIIYPYEIVDKMEIQGKDLTLIATPKDNENEFQFLNELFKAHDYKVRFKKNMSDEKANGEDIIIYLDNE